jgi:hypothetical protein
VSIAALHSLALPVVSFAVLAAGILLAFLRAAASELHLELSDSVHRLLDLTTIGFAALFLAVTVLRFFIVH